MQGPELDPGLDKLDEVFWAFLGKSQCGLYSSQSKILLGRKVEGGVSVVSTLIRLPGNSPQMKDNFSTRVSRMLSHFYVCTFLFHFNFTRPRGTHAKNVAP